MKFRITYQKNNRKETLILAANTKKDLQKLDAYPSNVMQVKAIETFSFSFGSFKNHKKEIYEFFSQLDIMLYSHLTFSEAIDLLLSSKQEKMIQEILEIIKASLNTSITIKDALAPYQKYIGETSILFLELGLENGNIKESVHSLVEILREDMESKEKLQEVLRYPFVLIVSLLVSIVMIFVYVLPNFEFVFTLLKDEVPYPTQVLLGMKILLQQYFLELFISLIVIFMLFFYMIQKYKLFFDRMVIDTIPMISTIMKDYYFYRLFLSISVIVKSKYQFQLAIAHSKNIIKNLYVQKVMQNVMHSITNGTTISEAFHKSKLFDDLTIKLLHIAEQTNQYEVILIDIAFQHKKRFHKSLKNFSTAIEPLLILCIALIILWLIIAIMLPIWNLGAVIH